MRKRLAKITVYGGLSVGAFAGSNELFGAFDEWRDARVAEQDERDRQVAAEERAASEAAKRAQQRRDDRVRQFDREFDVEADGVLADQAGLAAHSDQFIDERVPVFATGEVSHKLATNLNEPRAFAAPEVDVNEDGQTVPTCLVYEFPIDAGETFRVVHDGDKDSVYGVRFDPASDRFVVCNYGSIDIQSATHQGASATKIVVQRGAGE